MKDEALLMKCRNEAMKVGFLTEAWERHWYVMSLYNATLWGRKKDRENEEYFSKNHLTDKYNL